MKKKKLGMDEDPGTHQSAVIFQIMHITSHHATDYQCHTNNHIRIIIDALSPLSVSMFVLGKRSAALPRNVLCNVCSMFFFSSSSSQCPCRGDQT